MSCSNGWEDIVSGALVVTQADIVHGVAVNLVTDLIIYLDKMAHQPTTPKYFLSKLFSKGNIFLFSYMLLVFVPNLLQAAPSCLPLLTVERVWKSGPDCVEVSSFSKSLIIRIMAGRNSLV